MVALRAKLARAEEVRVAAAASAIASQAAAAAAQSEAEAARAKLASPAPAPAPALGPGPSAWQVHKTEDGREYYHNTATNETTWTTPPDLDTELRASTVAV